MPSTVSLFWVLPVRALPAGTAWKRGALADESSPGVLRSAGGGGWEPSDRGICGSGPVNQLRATTTNREVGHGCAVGARLDFGDPGRTGLCRTRTVVRTDLCRAAVADWLLHRRSPRGRWAPTLVRPLVANPRPDRRTECPVVAERWEMCWQARHAVKSTSSTTTE